MAQGEKEQTGNPVRPARFSNTDAAESESVTALRSLLDTRRVRHDFREGDKTPNLDGYIVLIDDSERQIGKLEVQIKTLPSGAMAYRCPSSLVAYSQESTTLPVILVCVDSANSRAYWKQVSESVTGYARTQQTFTVHFDEALDLINRSDSCPCYHRWLEITEEYKERIQRYRTIAPEVRQQRTATSLGQEHWEAVQRYADTVNTLFDDDFKVVKGLLFPGVWKFGIGYRVIDQETVLCQLSSIPKGQPAPVIFQLSDEVSPTCFTRNVHTSIVRGRQKFLAQPEQCAREYVFDFVRNLWRAQGFPIHGAEMAADVVLDFVQLYRRWLDLPPDADEYCMEDLRRGFGPVLSRNTGVAAARMAPGPSGMRAVNLDSTVDLPDSSSLLGENATARPYLIVASRVPIRSAFASLALLSAMGMRRVTRRFRAHDLEYQPPPNNFIWSCYSREREVENAGAILTRVLSEYEIFVRSNGFHFESSPYLDEKVSVLFEYHPSEGARDPEIQEWHLRDPHRVLAKTTLLDPHSTGPSHQRTLTVNDVSFEVIRTVSRSAAFLFMRCPLSNLVYRFLADDLHTHYQMRIG